MPTPESDPHKEQLARQIAMDICDRRRAGENISDEEVLRQHPTLASPLREQLERLHRLETARIHADLESSDLQQTCDLPPAAPPLEDSGLAAMQAYDLPDESSQFDQPLRQTVQEQVPESDFNATVLISHAQDEETTDESRHRTPLYRPSVRSPMGILRLYHDGMPTYTEYPIFSDRFRLGRTDGDLVVAHDFWMSGKHAEIQRRRVGEHFQWYLVDLKSTNGTFVRTDRVALKHNDELFLGQERFRFLADDSVCVLSHVTKGDGERWPLTTSPARIGRYPSAAMRVFENDPYLDPLHAELVRQADGSWCIQDRQSVNGVWYRVRETQLLPDSAFQLGEQRFGFWCFDDRCAENSSLRLYQAPVD